MSNLNFNPKRNQNDVVDNFAFIFVLTDSLFSSSCSDSLHPRFTNSQHSVTFFFIVKIVSDICILNMSISIFRLCYYAHVKMPSRFQVRNSPKNQCPRNGTEINIYYVLIRIDLARV
jgi:hypothetical protein